MQSFVPLLVAAGPLALLAAGLAPAGWAARHPRRMARLAAGAAGVALAAAVLAAALAAVGGRVEHVFAGPLGVYYDALSATMLLLVAFVGLIVTRYTVRYLEGDAGQGRFLRWLCLTLAAVLTLMVAGNLALLAAAWIGTSLALHRLLVFYPERRAAQLAARKKFIASRIADACVILAAILVYQQFGTVSFGALFAPGAPLAAGGQDVTLIGVLLVVAALLKSAQFPFHGWLPEVMETPTPVSALLHAGIVNAGGFLIVRMSPLMSQAGGALEFLAVVGGVTAIFGAVVMLTQTNIKGSLAWSTVAQMGFMLLQCGLGAFAAAVLHIVAHSLYKAYAFLSSGSVVEAARAAWTPAPGRTPRLATLLLVLALAVGAALGTAALFGMTLETQPGVVALAAILAMAVTHLLVQAFQPQPAARVVLRAVGLAAMVCLAYLALQTGAEALLAGSVAPTMAAQSPAELALPVLAIAAFAGVFLLQALLGSHAHRPAWRALYVHLANGLYVNTYANRLVQRVWPVRPTPLATPARSAA